MKLDAKLKIPALIALFISATVLIIIFQAVLHSEISPSQSYSWSTTIISPIDNKEARKKMDFDLEELKKEILELKKDVKELRTIKVSTLNELQHLGRQHYESMEKNKQLSSEKLSISNDLRKSQKQLLEVKKNLGALQSAFAIKKMHINIPMAVPKMPVDLTKTSKLKSPRKNSTKLACTFSSCFDHSLCPLLSRFSVFVHQPSKSKNMPFDFEKTLLLYNEMSKMSFFVANEKEACLYLVIIVIDFANKLPIKHQLILKYLESLSTWKKNGQNHLLLFSMKNTSNNFDCRYLQNLANTQASIIAPTFCPNTYRDNFDLMFYQKSLIMIKEDPWRYLPPLVPVKRRYLFTINNQLSDLSREDLVSLKGGVTDVYIYTRSGCSSANQQTSKVRMGNCKNHTQFGEILRNSMFNLLYNVKNYGLLLDGIYTSFREAVIPVLIGEWQPLPFEHLIDYNKAILVIPAARITETHFILRTMKMVDIFSMRRKGRFIFETYFSSLIPQLKSIFAVLKHRIKLPPIPLLDYKAKPLFKNLTVNGVSNSQIALKSAKFDQNWTLSSVNFHELWNNYPGGHYLIPYTPKHDVLPSSVQFVEDAGEYMPIGNGGGGDGTIFVNSLGGDQAVEHFTIIILTYNRELILTESLQRLVGLKYLNRVLVIWNNPVMPSADLDWPDIGVPIHVVKGEKNSLNNRFLPYDLIDTEAVLSMDDDIYLRHDEIELAFRVWRENRDRIVGFPGRYHSWNSNDNTWSYDANVACELSMVLTGGAFFHKYYSYLYTYLMPNIIRKTVDELMNCEDIAMNFLVSHVTNKPPIKVTSRWTFRCPGCPTSLSSDQSHYTERTKCINFFERVYGYMPLRRTQFRADSVLFKTRLPAGKHKCYKFV